MTVIKQTDDYIDKNGIHRSAWECICDCGKIKNVTTTCLKQGIVKSCGCLRPQKTSNHGKNKYENRGNFIIGYDESDNEFIIDKEDFERIKLLYWSMDAQGYFNTYKNNKKIKQHRYIMDCNSDELVVDHINHVKHDNRKCNLRISTRTENARNNKLSTRNTSSITGVRWHKRYNKWIANITVNKRLIHLGYFTKFEDAVSARKHAEEKYFKEYSYDNSIQLSEIYKIV